MHTWFLTYSLTFLGKKVLQGPSVHPRKCFYKQVNDGVEKGGNWIISNLEKILVTSSSENILLSQFQVETGLGEERKRTNAATGWTKSSL